MSALAMILMAAMVVPADGPEKVSGEMRKSQRLDLKGRWAAVVYPRGQVLKGEATVVGGHLQLEFRVNNKLSIRNLGKVVDEGSGNLQIGRFEGIYEQDGDRLRICLSLPTDKRPTSFQADVRKCLMELSRIRPSK